jgi:hypothetical protein
MAVLYLQVAPYPHAEMFGNLAKLQISWLIGDKVYPFAGVDGNAEFQNFFIDLKAAYADDTIELIDKRRKCCYPDCNCPFDAPKDPNWCARGYLRGSQNVHD